MVCRATAVLVLSSKHYCYVVSSNASCLSHSRVDFLFFEASSLLEGIHAYGHDTGPFSNLLRRTLVCLHIHHDYTTCDGGGYFWKIDEISNADIGTC